MNNYSKHAVAEYQAIARMSVHSLKLHVRDTNRKKTDFKTANKALQLY